MKHVRLIVIVLSFLGAAVVAGAFYWMLPKTALVQITGTEVKRQEGPAMRDVRYIQGVEPGSGTAHVFRNEDTRWGFPPYFKFNSSDLAASAQAMARDTPNASVLVTYYGVRNHLFDWYPNVLRLEVVATDYAHIPIFNIVFLVVFWGLIIFLYIRTRRGLRKLGQRFRKKTPPPAG